eukprot:m.81777 g.81777  ORF g.81777 m.81777 type:complete len:252 (-) comp8653_c0_seq3:415-1170(-)
MEKDASSDHDRDRDHEENEYLLRHLLLMQEKPKDVELFSHPLAVSEERREELVGWLRSTEEESPLKLQILFSFSIPSTLALERLMDIGNTLKIERWFSCGSGTAYWEALLEARGLTFVCFDKNTLYPEEMRFMAVRTAGPETLSESTRDDALFLAWPDAQEESTFGEDCVKGFNGNVIVHVGELFGETIGVNPYGQSTSKRCQEALAAHFRITKRIPLPQWPYQCDSLTVWRRITDPVSCDNNGTQYVSFI